MTLRLLQVLHHKSNMRSITSLHLIGTITWLRLCRPPCLLLPNQVNFRVAFTKPCSWEVKIAGARHFIHPQHLSIKIARSLNILDKHRRVIQTANLHHGILSWPVNISLVCTTKSGAPKRNRVAHSETDIIRYIYHMPSLFTSHLCCPV